MAQAAKEYAKALYGAFTGQEDKKETLSFLRGFNESLQNDSLLMDQIKSKALSTNDIKKTMAALLEKTVKSSNLINFFNLLADKGRMELIPEVADHFEALMDEENGIARGVVKSAVLLSPEKRGELEERLSKKMDKKVILTYKQDNKVVAGVKVEIGAFTFDDTVETHIKKIKENLNRSWS